MKRRQTVSKVQLVPIDKITVINSRRRNRKVFEGIVRSISQLGLKRPITVIRRASPGGETFDLVCGEGRMEAFKVLRQTEIPALVIEATTEEALVMGLVENVARRQHRAIDLLQDVEGMKRRGHSIEQIAHKTDLSPDYVRGVTPDNQLVAGRRRRPRATGVTDEQLSIMQRESATLDREFRVIEESYGLDHLDLVLAKGYLGRMLANAQVHSYLERHHKDLLIELKQLTEQQASAA
jgi:ParB family chromosome partitioning protein